MKTRGIPSYLPITTQLYLPNSLFLIKVPIKITLYQICQINRQTIMKFKKIKQREKSKFFTICDTKNSPKISCSLQCWPLANLKCCEHLNTRKKRERIKLIDKIENVTEKNNESYRRELKSYRKRWKVQMKFFGKFTKKKFKKFTFSSRILNF